jgi:hypothetical protein
MMNMSDMLLSMRTESKLGYTTTVKEQVDEIEVRYRDSIEQDIAFQEVNRKSAEDAERNRF